MLDAFAASLPDGVSTATALILVGASFLTSALTAAFGIGGGVAMLSIMGIQLPVAALIPVHGAVQLGSNTGRAIVQRRWIVWMAVLPFLAGGVIGAAFGAPFVVRIDDALLKIALGLFILVVTWTKLPALRQPGAPWFFAGGLITFFLTMFFGATGPLTAVFLEKAFGERRNYVATHAAVMTAQHLGKIVAFGFAGFAFAAWLPLMLAMIATGFAGTVTGSRLLARLPEPAFRTGFRWVLTVLALDLARRGILAIFSA